MDKKTSAPSLQKHDKMQTVGFIFANVHVL